MKKINSFAPSEAFKRQYIKPSFVQILVCQQPGTEPVSKPMMTYCWLGAEEYNSYAHICEMMTILPEHQCMLDKKAGRHYREYSRYLVAVG